MVKGSQLTPCFLVFHVAKKMRPSKKLWKQISWPNRLDADWVQSLLKGRNLLVLKNNLMPNLFSIPESSS